MQIPQPTGYPDCYSFQHIVRGGRRGTGKPRLVRISVPARLLVPVDRFDAGMTVGNGHYHMYSHTDRPGAPVQILGFFTNGTVNTGFTGGGCGLLSMADVEIIEWPAEIPAEERELYETTAPHVHNWQPPQPEVFPVQRRPGRHLHCAECHRWQYHAEPVASTARFNESEVGTFDGFAVFSDADPGL